MQFLTQCEQLARLLRKAMFAPANRHRTQIAPGERALIFLVEDEVT